MGTGVRVEMVGLGVGVTDVGEMLVGVGEIGVGDTLVGVGEIGVGDGLLLVGVTVAVAVGVPG